VIDDIFTFVVVVLMLQGITRAQLLSAYLRLPHGCVCIQRCLFTVHEF